MAANGKRAKMEGASSNSLPAKKGKIDTRNYYAKAYNDSYKKPYLKPGQRGFMVTCNMRGKDCLRDSYRLLNEYADEMYGKLDAGNDAKEASNSEDEEDISVLVEKQAEAARKEKRVFRFQSVDTGLNNCYFISTILDNPKELALKILNDLAKTRKLKSRFILRLMPIEVVTKANLKDIIDGAGGLFDKYFLGEPKTFAIMFNHRHNNSLDRSKVINELAGLINSKNMCHKANLKQPELAVIVEVIKGLCLISVLPQYYELRKYNLAEICGQKTESEGSSSNAPQVAVEEKEEKQCEKPEVVHTVEAVTETSLEEVKSSSGSQPVEGEKTTETQEESVEGKDDKIVE
ncbi:THUMP domain-containing protein 1 homolog [Wyeomyia smithii]|uniref:THUMP domain-containing protein 1 homolog n=1 Tax=Wyeomyia smithii TaxID=174621 RepID=UPI002467E52C|nr:THUMP domain-containing protein 1 homolog [Wyeomyia smithii]